MRIRKQQIIGKISLEKHMYSIGTDRFLEIMANALGLKTEALLPLCLTGGLCEACYISEMLGKELGHEILTDPLCRYAGSLGGCRKSIGTLREC